MKNPYDNFFQRAWDEQFRRAERDARGVKHLFIVALVLIGVAIVLALCGM